MLIFNRKDVMHGRILEKALGAAPRRFNAFYLPSSEKFATAIAAGWACGMLPEQQAGEYVGRGELVDLLSGHVFHGQAALALLESGVRRAFVVHRGAGGGARARELVQRPGGLPALGL